MAHRVEKNYKDPIECPICGKVFGEWEELKGKATIKKWCTRCKKVVYITRVAI